MSEQYPRVFEPTGNAFPGGVFLVKQDDIRIDNVTAVRKMVAHADTGNYYLGLSFHKEVAEYPPVGAGGHTVGIRLGLDEAAALWYSLGEFLIAQTEADERMRRKT